MEFEKENLKRKNDESKDALKSKYLKNQIFQLDLELSQVTDEDEKKRLEALRNVYIEKLQENKKRRFNQDPFNQSIGFLDSDYFVSRHSFQSRNNRQ